MNRQPSARNRQLDFFRGIALAIIFVNHMPGNPWFFYTPSRFGFSDAADIFVFLSGFASALVYGRCLERAGFALGVLRILLRCRQIYAAHLASFFLLAAVCLLGERWQEGRDYIGELGIGHFFDRPRAALLELATLRYVPHHFDILPLYLAILPTAPLVWALARLHISLALALPLSIYAGAHLFGWELPADPAGGESWYFNPFAWQLTFFAGFAFGAGWLKAPRDDARWIAGCLALVLLSVPLAHEATLRQFSVLADWRICLEPWLDKSHLGILRWVHLLALAYLANCLFVRKAHWLEKALPRCIARMGQYSLSIFLGSLTLSFVGGMALDRFGRDALAVAGVNLAGLCLLSLAANALSWLDSKPWTIPAERANCGDRPFRITLPAIGAGGGVWLRRAVAMPAMALIAASPIMLSEDDVALQNAQAISVSESVAAPEDSEDRVEWQDGV